MSSYHRLTSERSRSNSDNIGHEQGAASALSRFKSFFTRKKAFTELGKDSEEQKAVRDLGKVLDTAIKQCEQAVIDIGKGKNRQATKKLISGIIEAAATTVTTMVGIPSLVTLPSLDLAISGISVSTEIGASPAAASIAQEGLGFIQGRVQDAIEGSELAEMDDAIKMQTLRGRATQKLKDFFSVDTAIGMVPYSGAAQKTVAAVRLFAKKQEDWNKEKNDLIVKITKTNEVLETLIQQVSLDFDDVQTKTQHSFFPVAIKKDFSELVRKYLEESKKLEDKIKTWELKDAHAETKRFVDAGSSSSYDADNESGSSGKDSDED